MSFKTQPQDFFSLTGTGINSATGQFAPEAPAFNPTKSTTTTPYYTTYYNGTQQYLGYTFAYWDSYAYSNPLTASLPKTMSVVPFIGAFAVNELSLKIDQIVITNDYTSTATIDLLKVSPANINDGGVNTIPAKQIARYHIDSGETISLNKDDIDIVLKNYVPQTAVLPYYMTGDGFAMAFPDSIKTSTTGTTTKVTTYSTLYGVYNISVVAQAHFEV